MAGRITAIRVQKRNKDRANVYIDGKGLGAGTDGCGCYDVGLNVGVFADNYTRQSGGPFCANWDNPSAKLHSNLPLCRFTWTRDPPVVYGWTFTESNQASS